MTARNLIIMVAVLVLVMPRVVQAEALPQEHEYQRVLRAHMATLTEADFAHGVTKPMSESSPSDDLEVQFRNYLLTLMHQPLVGSKRGAPAVNAPAHLFTLETIEGSDEGVLLPPVWPEALMAFAQWDYAGNPYHDNRALKLRAFVTATIMMVMTDDYLNRHPQVGRSDQFAYQLVYWGSPYLGFRTLLPGSVRQAYATGMRRMAERIMAWGPAGEDVSLDLIAPVGLWYAREAVDDPAFRAKVDRHIARYFNDPAILHPAGYWVERGGPDFGFAGMANFFAGWVALASGRDDARDALERIYRLRAHLILPEPEGGPVSPTHFQTRIGMPAHADQWRWNGARDWAAAFVTPEAAHAVDTPTAAQLAGAAADRARDFAEQLRENPVDLERTREEGHYVFYENDELESRPWIRSAVHHRADHAGKWRMWMTWHFPASVNPAYEFYRPGAWASRVDMERRDSPWLKSPFNRGEHFIRNFAQAFFVANRLNYRAIVHTGPVGPRVSDQAGPLGFGGGQLSAFSTPSTGAVILGRRSGAGHDVVDQWRRWPSHSVTGRSNGGAVFTSARIVNPEVTSHIDDANGRIVVTGDIPNTLFDQEAALEGHLDYRRTFKLDNRSVEVLTRIEGDGADSLAELYEVLPIFRTRDHRKEQPQRTTIEFNVDGDWHNATDQNTSDVGAVRLNRYEGSVVVRFDRPRVARLSSADWEDGNLSHAACRNVLIDLLENDGQPLALDGSRRVSYRIEAESQ